jgi:hypothetical protein
MGCFCSKPQEYSINIPLSHGVRARWNAEIAKMRTETHGTMKVHCNCCGLYFKVPVHDIPNVDRYLLKEESCFLKICGKVKCPQCNAENKVQIYKMAVVDSSYTDDFWDARFYGTVKYVKASDCKPVGANVV